MKAWLMLAEAATVHPDGTISLLRSWIDHVAGPQLPIPFRGNLVVRIKAEQGDVGLHNFDVRGLDGDGKEVMPTMEGEFTVEKGGGATMFVVVMHMGFKKPGNHEFILRVDKVQLAAWAVAVAQTPAKGA